MFDQSKNSLNLNNFSVVELETKHIQFILLYKEYLYFFKLHDLFLWFYEEGKCYCKIMF